MVLFDFISGVLNLTFFLSDYGLRLAPNVFEHIVCFSLAIPGKYNFKFPFPGNNIFVKSGNFLFPEKKWELDNISCKKSLVNRN